MSRLTQRGTTKASLYSQSDADAFIARSRQPHSIRWKVDVYRWLSSSGPEENLMYNVPIIGGELTMDSSDPIRRKLTLEVGAGADLEPRTSNDPLVPFGQFIRLYVSIDRSDGTWFPWMRMGEFQIRSYVYERPSEIATVEAADFSALVGEFLHEKKKSYGNRTVGGAIDEMVRAALPNSAYKREFNSYAYTIKAPKTFVAPAGSSRWEQAVKLAESTSFDVFFDWAGDLVLRPNIGDGQDDIPPENGPDVGTKSNPIATIADGVGGSLIGMTATVTRDGAANGVFINIHETADQKSKTKQARAARGDSRVNVQVKALAGSIYPSVVAYGDKFGRIPIVLEKNVEKITDVVTSHWEGYAHTLLNRRRGLVRYIDFLMVGGYWLEPDDKVKIKWQKRSDDTFAREEDHYVQAITFDLAGGPVKVRTRQLNVSDPGA